MKYTDKVSDVSKEIIQNLANEDSANANALLEWGAAMHRDGIKKGAGLVCVTIIIVNSVVYSWSIVKSFRKSKDAKRTES